MAGWLSRLFGGKPALPRTGEALAVPVAMLRPSPDVQPTAAAVVFTSSERFRDDPVFLCRVQWRLEQLLYDGGTPQAPADEQARDRLREMKIGPELPRVYHLSDTFAPGTPLYVADLALPASLYRAGFDFGDHDRLLRVRFDLTGPQPVGELLEPPPDPTATARARLDALLARGARFVWAELAQANYKLYEPGPASAPCMVMFSFDFRVSADEMRAWSEQLHPLKHTNPEDPVLREAVWPLEVDDRSWFYHRRFTMPGRFTGGREVFLADLWVHRPFIQGRFPHRKELGGRPRRVPCLAEKRETGWAGIELVPFAEAEEYRRRAAQARE